MICSNMKCSYTNDVEGEFCPECGSKTSEYDSNLIFAKQNCPVEKTESTNKTKYVSFKSNPNSPQKKKERKQEAEINQKLLFNDSMDDNEIQYTIKKDMLNLNGHEAGTKWMRIGTLLSFNATQQMIGAGFKAIIDQNKILIKQNELLLRELKKSNASLDLNSDK